MRTARQAASLVVVMAITVLCGCLNGGEEQGPLFVAVIVDSSASVAEFEKQIMAYAKLALDEYCRTQEVHVAVVNLDEDPKVEFQKTGDFYEEDIEEILSHIEAIDHDAKGTDIIGALDLVMTYYSYQKLPPSGLKILCFTDGYIDAQPGGTVRQWDEFDWERLAQMNAGVGFYFIATDEALRAKIQTALGSINDTVVRNENEALDDLKLEEPAIP